jgi:opacity protein-like surface antigen
MRYFLAAIVLLASPFCSAQLQDSSQTRLNTIKVNLITSLIYANSGAISYERVTKPNESWSATIGYVQFPKLGNLSSGTKVSDKGTRGGYVIGGEYRFYLRKENKFQAPHGVFIGPYANYFYFKNDRTLTSADGLSQAILASKITVLNIGFQLGYQFVIKNRWTIDLIFLGPSVSRYNLGLDLSGDFDSDTVLENEIIAALADRFPLIKDLITDQSVDLNGTTSTWSGGFRYQVNLGYHFGRSKKR